MIRDFFDVTDDEPDTALLASNSHHVTMTFSDTPCQKAVHSIEEWIEGMEHSLKAMYLHMRVEQKRSLGTWSICAAQCPPHRERSTTWYSTCRRTAGCMRARSTAGKGEGGMGLLLEACVHVIEEMNR